MTQHEATVKVNNTYAYINMRDTASANGADVGNFYKGQVAIGTLVGVDPKTQWLKVEVLDNNTLAVPVYIAAWLCDLTEVSVTPPPADVVINSVTLDYDTAGDIVGVWVNGVEFTRTPPPAPPVG